jgi:membrane protein implicated in regulation of membrane protease activity
MDAWIAWVIAGVVLAVGEVLTVSLYLGPFALGAFAAALVDLLGGGTALPWVVFLVVSLLVLGIVRPIARSHRRMPARLRTGTAALVGRDALVVEPIGGLEGVGRVKIDGDVWTARAYDGDEIPAGRRVHVVEIRGVTALVAE